MVPRSEGGGHDPSTLAVTCTAHHRALHDGRLAGAGIDVYEREPIAPDHPLCRMDHVILSSHAAWYSEEAQYDVKNRAAQAAADLFLGRIPEHVVNPEVLELPQPRWRG